MAESRIDVLIRLKDELTKGLKTIRTELDAVNDEAEALNGQDTKDVRKEYDRLEKEITDIKSATEKANAQLDTVRNAGLAIAGLGAAIAAPFLIGLRSTAQFSTEVAEVGTLVDDAVQSTEELRQTIIELSNEFGQARGEVARGLYQAISSGAAAGAEANEILRVALITARGGVTSVSAAVDGLSTVMNSFGFSAEEAETVADKLFVTVKNGRTTIDELSRFLFQAAPVASQLGVRFEELNAALVTLTKQGVPTRVAFTQIRSAINGIVRDTPELNEIFEDLGGAQKVIAEQGLAKAFDIVRKAANGNVGVLNKLLGSIEGVGAVLGLTGPQLDEFRKQLEDQVNASGDAAAAAAEVEEAFGTSLEQAVTRTGNAFEALGDLVVPAIQPIVVAVGELAAGFTTLLEQSPVVRFVTAFTATLGLAATALGTLAVSLALVGRGLIFVQGSIGIVTAKMTQLGLTTGVAATAMRGFGLALRFAVPILGLVVTALALFAGSAAAAEEDVEDLADANERLKQTFNDLDDVGQVRALSEAQQTLRELKAAAREAQEEIDRLGSARGQGRRSANRSIARLKEDLAGLNADIKDTEELIAEFTDKIETISDAEINPENLKQYQDDLKETEDAIAELIAEAETLREVSIQAVEDPAIKGGIANRKARRDQKERIRLATEERDLARERIAEINDEVTILRTAQGVLQRRVEAASDQADEIERQADAEKRKQDLTTENLRIAAEELSIARSLTKQIQAQTAARSRLQQAINRQQAARDRAALAAGDITGEEFAERERGRIDAQLQADLEGLRKRLDAVTAEGEAKIANLKAKAAADTSKDLSDQIAAAEVALVTAQQKIGADIAVTVLNAQTDTFEAGARLAESAVEGFQSQVTNISTVLQAELIRLKALLDSDEISPQEFADKVRAANDQAIASYNALRQALVEALAVAGEGPEAEALIAMIELIDGKVKDLTTTISVFESQVLTATEGALADFFEEILQGTDDINEAFTQMLQSIGDRVKRLIAEKLAQKLLTSLFGGESVLGSLLGSGGGLIAARGGYIAHAARGGYMAGLAMPTLQNLAQRRRGTLTAHPSGNVYRAAKGGGVLKVATGGGKLRGPGTKVSDSIPAMLSAGEYVIKAAAVDKYGVQLMEAINRGVFPKPARSNRKLSITRPRRTAFADGGFVGTTPLESQAGAGSQGIQNAATAERGRMTLEVNEATLGLTMRDFLEREFGRIMATR
jgi:TP901 family phage tail tape measure protein